MTAERYRPEYHGDAHQDREDAQDKYKENLAEQRNKIRAEEDNQASKENSEGPPPLCPTCNVPLGTGTCVKCIRIRRERGEEYPELMDVTRSKVKKIPPSRIVRQLGIKGSPEWQAIKEKIKQDVAKDREAKKKFRKNKNAEPKG